jgi:HPt (histidine-containing phosphotransfer) domain-containing protein
MIIDLSYLKELSNDDSSFIKDMAGIFKQQVEEYAIQMPELLAKADYQNLSRMAHKAKSSLAVMGMKKDAEILKELEIKSKQEVEIDTYQEMIDTFIENSKSALDELKEYLI